MYRPAAVGTYATRYLMSNQIENYKSNPFQGYQSSAKPEDSQVIRLK